nr:conjugal transfer protein TraX [Lachnospiraceae bacterium]
MSDLPFNKIIGGGLPKFLNENMIKVMAVIFMIMDHIAVFLVPTIAANSDAAFFASSANVLSLINILRGFGRLAFPLFAFFIVEGITHTRDIKKYALRILILAVISEVPFDMAYFGTPLNFEKQNVLITLFLGLCAIAGVDSVLKLFENDLTKRIMLSLSIILFACVAAYFLKCDYSYAGILAMIALYFFRQDHVKSIFACCIILICGYS